MTIVLNYCQHCEKVHEPQQPVKGCREPNVIALYFCEKCGNQGLDYDEAEACCDGVQPA